MFGFPYEYVKTSEIFGNILKISEYSITEFIILFLGLAFIISMVFFVIPKINLYLQKNNQEKERKAKKRMMNKIILQKNLEDLVMREVNEKNVNN